MVSHVHCTASNSNLDNIVTLINNELNNLEKWFCADKMAINVNKTKFVVFHLIAENGIKIFYNDNHSDQSDPRLMSELELYHNKHPDNNCGAYKLLGIYFDENLTLTFLSMHFATS
jgi:hypothetical protein